MNRIAHWTFTIILSHKTITIAYNNTFRETVPRLALSRMDEVGRGQARNHSNSNQGAPDSNLNACTFAFF